MIVGTLFTLFVVPVFYALIAAQRQPSPMSEATELKARPQVLAEAAVRVLSSHPTATIGSVKRTF